MVSRSRSHSHRILGLSSVGDLGHVAVVVVDVVVDGLNAAVRESHGVGTLSLASSVILLSGVEVGFGVVIRDGVLVGVGGDLVRVDLSSMSNHGSMIGRGSMNNRGSMDHRGGMVDSVDNRSSMVDSMGHWSNMVGSMDKRGSMVDSMGHRGNMVGSMDKRGSMVDSMCYRSSMSHNSMRSSMVTS